MTNFPTPGRSAWLFTVLVAASSMACAVWLTHVTSGYAENIIMRTGFQGDLTPAREAVPGRGPAAQGSETFGAAA